MKDIVWKCDICEGLLEKKKSASILVVAAEGDLEKEDLIKSLANIGYSSLAGRAWFYNVCQACIGEKITHGDSYMARHSFDLSHGGKVFLKKIKVLADGVKRAAVDAAVAVGILEVEMRK